MSAEKMPKSKIVKRSYMYYMQQNSNSKKMKNSQIIAYDGKLK